MTTQMQSEFIKICFIITFSKHLSWLREKKMIEKFSGVLFLALHAMIPMAIIHIQGDDGTVLIFALMFFGYDICGRCSTEIFCHLTRCSWRSLLPKASPLAIETLP